MYTTYCALIMSIPQHHLLCSLHIKCGPGRSVGTATGYGMESGDRIPVGARFSTPVQTGPGAHPAPVHRYWVFPRGKQRPGRENDPPPPSSVMVKKE